MGLAFPHGFLFGTATAATQIETASDNAWHGLKAKDGSVLLETIEHEKHREEDADIIASLGNAYRCGPDWPRLQTAPYKPLAKTVVNEYRDFFGRLRDKDVYIMLVLHHFTEPRWFSWEGRDAPEMFRDYASRAMDAFGDLVSFWNTINEPAVYVQTAYLNGNHPPHKRNPLIAYRVLKHLSKGHRLAYRAMKEKRPESQIGISNNTMVFSAEHPLGIIPAGLSQLYFHNYVPDHFTEVDFVGISYYGRISFAPLPLTEIMAPGKLEERGRKHDMMWEYYPQGLTDILRRYWKRYGKPLIITENGCCPVNDDDTYRVVSITGHLRAAHEALSEGIDLRGYFHWSTFDNFEWGLGRSYRFGLYSVDERTFERKPKPSAAFYASIAKNCYLEV